METSKIYKNQHLKLLVKRLTVLKQVYSWWEINIMISISKLTEIKITLEIKKSLFNILVQTEESTQPNCK